MPEYKNQHYVPQFYLRGFADSKQGDRIGVFVIESRKFIVGAPIGQQASQDYFYGKDQRVETALSQQEGNAAPIIKQVCLAEMLPKQSSSEFGLLRRFTSLLLNRTRFAAETIESTDRSIVEHLREISQNHGETLDINGLTREEAAMLSVDLTRSVAPYIDDLACKLVVNDTGVEFITSDNPVVIYNQYLEMKKWAGIASGLHLKGLQLLLPISGRCLLVFYDPGTYKIGDKKDSVVRVSCEADVKSLNLLQLANFCKCVYFGSTVGEEGITMLHKRVNRRCRRKYASVSSVMHPLDEQRTLLELSRFDLRCNLDLSFIQIRKKARRRHLDPRIPPVRNPLLAQKMLEFRNLVELGYYKPLEFDKYLRESKYR